MRTHQEKYEELAQFKVLQGHDPWAPMALANGRMLVRDSKKLICITVDKAGHDYLRQMCDESRYMVIEDITALPRELPKIYQRVVRA